jgi:prepilin-type N-terminal cleavage/methylation domain-containing protein
MHNYSQKSFTLIELLVVIAIVGILAGVIIVSMASATDNARIAKAKVFSNSMRDSMGNNIFAEWKFDGTGVSNGFPANENYVKDTWGISNSTIVGSPTVLSGASCVFDSCLSFDGIDDYIASSSSPSGVMSVSLWLKAANSSTRQMLISRLTQAGVNTGFYMDINGTSELNGKVRFTTYSTAGSYGDSKSTNIVVDNKWHHIVAGYDGSHNFMYIDGIKQLDGVGASPGVAETNLRIGANWNAAMLYSGLMDDIRIYNSALSSIQIRSIYVAGLKELKKQIAKDDYNQRLTKLNNFCIK